MGEATEEGETMALVGVASAAVAERVGVAELVDEGVVVVAGEVQTNGPAMHVLPIL